MKNLSLYLILSIVFLINCSSNKKEETLHLENPDPEKIEEIIIEEDSFDWADYGIEIEKNKESYPSIKQNISHDKLKLLELYNAKLITMDSVSNYFTETVLNFIFPYWYGTTWDFNGHTDIPNDDYVACGYFVSTTLKHMGLNVNRFKLAQQSALNAIRTLSIDDTFYNLKTNRASAAIDKIKAKLSEGIYVVGLSCHVGFILYREDEVFFIHSDYSYPAEVKIEIAIESESFNQSDCFYLCPVSGNKSLLIKWLNGEEVNVITD